MVYVTHDQAEALSMADRIVVLHAGRVLQVGPPRGVYLAPATPLVARQLGAPPINLFEVHCDGERWFAREGTPLCAAPGEAVGGGLLGVRPEHAQLADQGAWTLTVEVIEMLGAERLVYGHVGGALFTLRIEGTLTPPSVGSQVRIDAPAARIHWFDAASGKRVG